MRQNNSKKGLIVALDVDTPARAKDVVRRLGKSVDFYKIAPSLCLQDQEIIRWLRDQGKKVFLDFKWYDIPSQVQRSVRQAGRLGVTSCTVHLSAGREALKAALAARPRPKIWGVSVLTSFSKKDLMEIGVSSLVQAQVLRLAKLAEATGLDGMVCSAQELKALKKFKSRLTLVTPGVQFGEARGLDQQRVAGPEFAWASGADYIVVGRSILEAKDPAAAARKILALR